jgi:uncharacterized phage protein (TIGR02218 family)
MKIYGAGFTAHLAQDATTLCYCWRIQRRDGTVFGFTDHDRDVVCDGTTYLATTGITTTKMVRRLGLSVDNLDLEGAIDDESLTALDIERGLFDDARVDLRIVNWSDPTQFDHLARGTFGNARMSENGFEVEFRSRAHTLNQPTGRMYQRSCDAKLGDSRCRYTIVPVTATVSSVVGQIITLVTIGQPDDWFSLGLLVDATGAQHKIQTHRGTRLTLWEQPVVAPLPGTLVTLTPGCRQTAEVCRVKFNNLVNFQGFPFVPGNDVLSKYPVRGKDNYNGGSLFK